MADQPASEQIDEIILASDAWKANTLRELREVILKVDPNIYEEVKWKMVNRPLGLPVWSYNGILCFAEIWKDNVKLLFPKGAKINDPNNQLNSRLLSKDIRAIEFKQGNNINTSELSELVRRAIILNDTK